MAGGPPPAQPAAGRQNEDRIDGVYHILPNQVHGAGEGADQQTKGIGNGQGKEQDVEDEMKGKKDKASKSTVEMPGESGVEQPLRVGQEFPEQPQSDSGRGRRPAATRGRSDAHGKRGRPARRPKGRRK